MGELNLNSERLKSQITELMDQNDEFSSSDIDIKISGDVIYLFGEVDGPDTKSLACEMIQKIRGVGKVVDELKVRREASSRGSYPLSKKASREARETGRS